MDYINVDVNEYVKNGLENGLLIPKKAIMFARVIARRGIVGEPVISWSVDGSGNEIKEKEAVVEIDETTNYASWVVTKVDENGNIIIDNNGHINQWIIADSVFRKKYEVDLENPSLFKPKGGIQIFVQIPHNIILSRKEQEMKIACGGFINITDFHDMYGISEKDFFDTYKFVD